MADVRSLPAPRHGDWDWQARAACLGTETGDFYHPDNERGPSRTRRETNAKAVCSGCAVIENCLRWAIATREPYGVWGGLSADEREATLARKPA